MLGSLLRGRLDYELIAVALGAKKQSKMGDR